MREKQHFYPLLPWTIRWSISSLCKQARRAEAIGIPAIAIFPATPSDKKTPNGEEAYRTPTISYAE